MSYKWIGAVLIIVGCGGVGFSVAAGHRKEEMLLRQLIRVLEYMECELQYRLTPLPELCRQAGREVGGVLREIFLNLSREMDWQTSPDVCSCMTAAIKKSRDMPTSLRRQLLQLGHMLGRFDLTGQLRGLQSVRENCEAELKKLEKNKDVRLRSYQTLGLCAGAALAILFA